MFTLFLLYHSARFSCTAKCIVPHVIRWSSLLYTPLPASLIRYSNNNALSCQVRVAQQLIGRRGKSERDSASAFPESDSLLAEDGEHQRCHDGMMLQSMPNTT